MKKEDEKDAINMLININQRLVLDNKEHIKKYYRIRDLHLQVIKKCQNIYKQVSFQSRNTLV